MVRVTPALKCLPAFYILHGDVIDMVFRADVEHLNNIGMAQDAGGTHFIEEQSAIPLASCSVSVTRLMRDFQRSGARDQRVMAKVEDTNSAATDFTYDGGSRPICRAQPLAPVNGDSAPSADIGLCPLTQLGSKPLHSMPSATSASRSSTNTPSPPRSKSTHDNGKCANACSAKA